MLRQCCWIIVGIYAPELVVFTAWRQWSSARLLGNIVKEVDANEDGVSESEEGSDESSGNDEDRDNVTSRHEILPAKQREPKRKYEWTMTHSFFASTGGFAFEIPEGNEYSSDKGSEFLPQISPQRLTITAKGIALLARCGHLPDVSEADILDKSKANQLAKILVLVQASWMLLQVFGRLIARLPVTLLEVNTVAHV
jgi:hypothetical protein